MIHIHEAVFKTFLGNLALLFGGPFLALYCFNAILVVSQAHWLVDALTLIWVLSCVSCWSLAISVGGLLSCLTAESTLRTMITAYKRSPTVYVLLRLKTDFKRLFFGPGLKKRIYNRSL